MVAQDKPILSPRDPTSLAQVAVSPLTGAGNLWLWQPQVRFEQRFTVGENTGLRAQVGIYQTNEPSSAAGPEYTSTLSSARPALQGRFEFWHAWGLNRRVEIAPGFHTSNTHVAGVSVPSRIASIDWLIQPAAKLRWTGMFFQGRNAAGIGGLRQGFTIFGRDRIVPIHAAGGWTQLSFLPTSRLSFNTYGGQESNRTSDMIEDAIRRNFVYAANGIYRVGSNLLIGLEASQVRTSYLRSGIRRNNHYDITLAYLF
jgi:hypothetical protein